MLWYLIALALGGVGWLYGRTKKHKSTYYDSDYRWDERWGWFWSFLVGGLFLAGVTNAVLNDHYIDRKVVSTESMEVVSDGSSTHGSFFLFSGYVKSDPVYNYYSRNDRGEYRLKQVYADYAFVTYTDATPQVIRYDIDSSNLWMALHVGWDTYGEWEFRIPEGSIKQNYTLDAQ
jgi:hypothetical protein